MASISVHAQPGIAAVKENWRPFLLIQGLALTVLVVYYTVPPVRLAAESLAHAKQAGGLALSALTTVIASVGLPALAKRLVGGRAWSRADIIFQICYFAVVGVIVDQLYRQLGQVFGTEVSLATVAKKLAFDLGFFCVFVSIPLTTVLFAWKDGRYQRRGMMELLSRGGFAHRYWPVLITCWAFWGPVLSAVYAMPPDLQFWLYLFTQAAWSLLLMGISARHIEIEPVVP